jgi:hypothetical protein
MSLKKRFWTKKRNLKYIVMCIPLTFSLILHAALIDWRRINLSTKLRLQSTLTRFSYKKKVRMDSKCFNKNCSKFNHASNGAKIMLRSVSKIRGSFLIFMWCFGFPLLYRAFYMEILYKNYPSMPWILISNFLL